MSSPNYSGEDVAKLGLIAVSLMVCFPIGLIILFVTYLGHKKINTSNISIFAWIQIIWIGLVAVLSPILCFLSLIIDLGEETPIGLFWFITIIEIIGVIIFFIKKLNK